MNELKYKDCVGTTTNGERVVNYTDSLENLLSGSLYSCDVEECNEDYDKVKDYINNLEQQLQAYKDKEEKIKKYINAHTTIFPLEYSSVDYIDYIADCEPILQILDEGSDGNE